MSAHQLAVDLESPLPASLPAGSAIALYCSGTAWGGQQPLEDLELLVDGTPRPLEAIRMPRFDMPVRRSGFWGVIPIAAGARPRHVELAARARGRGGRLEQIALGRIEIVDPEAPAPRRSPFPEGLIAICMATFDPDPELLRAQLESIRSQTDTSWTCVISDDHSSQERYEPLRALVGDDPRFVLSRSEQRLGFYRNFERALRLAPAAAELIALCDQDDVWHPDKLSTLRRSLGSATLVYSDQRLVDASGRLLRETMWRGRANNYRNLASMLIANTVTGAAALVRRDIAELALPFPDSPGIEFHDHWLALIALASGELAYVDRPLYDYVQHRGAILGKVAGDAHASGGRRRLVGIRMRDWRTAYFLGYIPGKVRARTLLLRCGDRLTPGKRRDLERYLASDSSAVSFAWFVLRPLRLLAGRTETLAAEWELARGIVWRLLATLIASLRWWPERWTLDTRLPDPPHFEQKRLRRWRSRV
jgi:glycosyltransferase involved in cell wall biosynthesis